MAAPVQLNKVLRSYLRRPHSASSFRLFCKLLLTALLFVNARSFPLVWHTRVLRHLVNRSIRSRLSITPRPSVKNNVYTVLNPFETFAVYKCWAGPDDCDFLFHLSNSSYAKNLDVARAEICAKTLSGFVEEGGWMPLAGADYLFMSEIPLFSKYEIRSRIGSWDDKWIYLVSEFVTYPKSSPPTKTEVNSVSKHKKRSVRADGSVLHCIAVSVYCFKLGRITVPPRIALSICGVGVDKKDAERVSLMKAEGKLRHFMRGGWQNEVGWDFPEFESQRLDGLHWGRKLTEGMKEAIGTSLE